MGNITLHCPACHETKRVARCKSQDPVGAVRVEIVCPKCLGDDFGGGEAYFDAHGREVVDRPWWHITQTESNDG